MIRQKIDMTELMIKAANKPRPGTNYAVHKSEKDYDRRRLKQDLKKALIEEKEELL